MQEQLRKVITIDGVASSGKTTVASTLAQKYNYALLDSGYVYRAFCWYLLDRNCVIEPRPVYLALQEFQASITDGGLVYIDETDATPHLHEPEITELVSLIGSAFFVRKHIREMQREYCDQKEGKVVVTGRDVGRDVFPESQYKFFLTASPETRAHRRFLQLDKNGADVSYDSIFSSIKKRDMKDETRQVSPMGAAEDAVIIDTSELRADEVLEEVHRTIERRRVCIEGSISRGIEF